MNAEREPEEEFDRFEGLTRQLLTVSKKELDEKKRTDSDPLITGVSKESKID